ncbi:uncharacterized protein TM35_000451700 [Trypanosoma theileri]|uniref:Mucin TcMUCII n=1 Tax=Trypanosoma theileri TaxID=67003 RepID=A0A1X0NI53_9TRYP|nr:uncharacterized protein TM35_000451700 [Trypanosoma theileri]ORC84432.1 hypothetical protein TM35_000451700 [Trypanosoma theileri]
MMLPCRLLYLLVLLLSIASVCSASEEILPAVIVPSGEPEYLVVNFGIANHRRRKNRDPANIISNAHKDIQDPLKEGAQALKEGPSGNQNGPSGGKPGDKGQKEQLKAAEGPGKEASEREITKERQDTAVGKIDDPTGILQGIQTQILSETAPSSSSSVVSSAPRAGDPTKSEETLSKQSESGGPAQDTSNQNDKRQGDNTQSNESDIKDRPQNTSNSTSSIEPCTSNSESHENSATKEQTHSTQDSPTTIGTGENTKAENTNSITLNTTSNEESITTTTTTTPLPPVSSNTMMPNVKGNVDSSSIRSSSSVWVRVPLLLVAVLFSATV